MDNEIIFVTSSCSKLTYEKIFKMRNRKMLDPAQKFFEQLIRGTSIAASKCTSKTTKVISLSVLPVSASTSEQKNFYLKTEKAGHILYIYPGFFNGKILRFITEFISFFFITLKLLRKTSNNKKQIMICDPLYFHVSKAVRFASRFYNIKTIAVITDIPIYATNMKQSGNFSLKSKLQTCYELMAMREVTKYDGYINLTRSMNSIINPHKKPSIVIEGSVDAEIFNTTNPQKSDLKRIILYAGGVYEKYGVKTLVNAFLKAGIKNTELHIYGNGTYVDELELICKKNTGVKYMGCILNTALLEVEKNASLLVNPRFSDEEYTRYSFPSKTLEYMASGTPLLSTRLDGIPKDYEEYLFWFNDESVNGMADRLREIMNLPTEQLENKGKSAQQYVFSKKNNIIQGKRILDFAETLLD